MTIALASMQVNEKICTEKNEMRIPPIEIEKGKNLARSPLAEIERFVGKRSSSSWALK